MSDSDSPDLPADLVELQRAADASAVAYEGYAQKVAAERRALFPAPEQVVERAVWPPEATAELNRLRQVFAEAQDAVRRHPAVETARHQGAQYQLMQKVQAEARREAEVPYEV